LRGLSYAEGQARLTPAGRNVQAKREKEDGGVPHHQECWDLAHKCDVMGVEIRPVRESSGQVLWAWTNVQNETTRWTPEEFLKYGRNILNASGGTWSANDLAGVVNRYSQWAAENYILPREEEFEKWNRNGSRWPRAWNKSDSDPNWVVQSYIDAGKNVGPGARQMASIMGYVLLLIASAEFGATMIYSGSVFQKALSGLNLASKLGIKGADLGGAFSASISSGAMGPNQSKYFKRWIVSNEEVMHRYFNTLGGGMPYEVRMDILEILRSDLIR